MLHSRQTHYDIVVPCFFPFSLMMQKIFEKLCVLSKWRLKDWKKRKGKKRKEIYTHSSNNIAHSRSMPKYSTCCRACKQIMFWEHQGSFTAKALKFLFYLSFCRMNSMRPFVYTRVQVSLKSHSHSHSFSIRFFFWAFTDFIWAQTNGFALLASQWSFKWAT